MELEIQRTADSRRGDFTHKMLHGRTVIEQIKQFHISKCDEKEAQERDLHSPLGILQPHAMHDIEKFSAQTGQKMRKKKLFQRIAHCRVEKVPHPGTDST